MTESRRRVYNRSWYKRECKEDMRKRRKEYNRKIRHAKIDDESFSYKNVRKLDWNTIS